MLVTNRSTSVPVLMYHSISNVSSARFRTFVVPPGMFDEHMAYLRDNQYQTMTMAELASIRVGAQAAPERAVAVTFDDGYQDFVSCALPTMTRYGIKSTLFVATRYIGGTSAWLAPEGEQDRSMVTWDELRAAVEQGVEVGAHTHSHPQMDRLERGAVAREIVMPKVIIEDQLQREVPSFAYPYGYFNAEVARMVEHFGYSSACTVGNRVAAPPDCSFRVPRLTVTPDLDAAGLGRLLGSRVTIPGQLESFGRRRASYVMRRWGLKKKGAS